MKKLLLSILLLSISTFLFSQTIQTKKFNSEILQNERYLKIYVPPSYTSETSKHYPLTIVFDAEYLFDMYVGNSILFATKDKAPEQIIVGINQNYNGERYEDCAYQKENSLPTRQGETFYQFVKIELMNYLEENYRISPFKTVVGNTLTANFINYFLIEQYPTFNAYINISPYYALDMPVLLHQKASNLKGENIYYYLSNNKNNSIERAQTIKDTDTILKDINNAKFKYKYDAFKNSSRTSAIGQSVPSALAFIFEMYSTISDEEFENNIKNMSPPDAIAYLENKYVEIEYLFGSDLKIREKDIFAIESIILDKENGDYLKNFGEMISKLYNESPIGDYYIGRYYETGKNYRLALRYYKSGYMKLPEGDPNSDGYYENIERVLQKRDGTYTE
ncbi:alpha/beta hydrolase-fold protein [Lutibacter sp. A80]|uniref:alpha/beta hydrolase n=1 Tax=Lutibacter sp. A80 TaxID=2918453 RepID=UPI001F05273E|nr:alpha/beta hydrolase-fold protein [Lutibacter sp. A80]UMB61012.1 alpha/beta hydrolase-fold protein [Lutibacter sp. A80]